MAENAGSIFSEVRVELDKLTGDVKKIKVKLDTLNNQTEKSAKKFTKTWDTAFTTIGLTGVASIALITAATVKSIGVFTKYEQSIANVAAVSGATGAELEELAKTAERAGQTTRFSASQAAEALFFLASAGLNAKKAAEALSGTLLLAGATGSELGFAAQTITSTLSQFNLEVDKAADVSNIFAAANANSQATLEKLSEAFKQVGPVAGGLGITLEETTGALQLLFNAGFRGQSAGRALKSALVDLEKPSDNLEKKIIKLGISVDDLKPSVVGIDGVIEALGKSGAGTADIIDLFGKVAGPQLAVLVGKGADEVRRLTEAVTDTEEAARQYGVQNETLAGSFDRFLSAVQAITISLVDKFAPALKAVVGFGTNIINFFNSFINKTSDLEEAVDDLTVLLDRYRKENIKTATSVKDLTDEQRKQLKIQRDIAQLEIGDLLSKEGRKYTENKNLLKGLNQEILNQKNANNDLVDSLNDNIDKRDSLLKKIDGESEKIKQLRAIYSAFADSGDTDKINKQILDLERSQAGYRGELARTKETLDAQRNQFANQTRELKDTQDEYDVLKNSIEELETVTVSLFKAGAINEKQLNAVNEALAKYVTTIAAGKVAQDGLKESTDDGNKNLDDTAKVAKKAESAYSALVRKMQEFVVENEDAIAGATAALGSFVQLFDAIGSLTAQLTENRLAAHDLELEKELEGIDAALQARLQAEGVAEETKIERLQRELAEAKSASDQETIDAAQQALTRGQIEEEFQKKKTAVEEASAKKRADIEFKGATAAWKLNVASSIAKGALAILNAFNAPYFLWPLTVPVATAAAGLQIGATAAAKPKKPSFQDGGIVPGQSFTGDNVPANVNSGEMFINQEQQKKLFDFISGGSASSRQSAKLIIDGKVLGQVIFDRTDNGTMKISSRGIRVR